ncbi:MAG: histidine kinase dimerization/phospho-acceptor domain-containing protein [Gallionellaceae bacterium]|nr:histidine kinase dimerization/phospho-acceptor domain-containing protein [Gallionellaceae bacterium]
MRNNPSSSAGQILRPHPYSMPFPQALWRSVYIFNFYRLLLGSLFVFLAGTFGDALSFGSRNLPLFFYTSLVYVALALVSFVAIKFRWPRFNWQLAFQVGTDIVCVTVLSHASGGIQSSMGVLLLVSLAAAGMISRGRITLFFAALATIAMLLQHSYMVLTQDGAVAQYVQVGVLSAAYFAVAWLAHTLTKYALASEKLAILRGVDLANMAEANRLVIQDMPDGVLVVDDHGVVRQYNPSVERLLGYVFADKGSVTLQECAPVLAEHFAQWRESFGHEYTVLRLPLTHHQARVRFLPVQRDGFWGAVVFVEDMQRVQAQAQQIKLAALGRLTANIAHEVRNPLSAISYATELLQEEKHDAAQERLFQIILDNSSRLNNIVLDVLQLNRRDRARRELFNLAEKLALFVDSLAHTEGIAREVFLLEVKPACNVNFDVGHFEQVLWNISRNALRYCRMQSGSVQLRGWCSDEGRAIVEISNDGPAVEPQAVLQLFEPFFTTAAGGTGLGLYIARELCEANDASLEYRQPVTGGACFRIEFGELDEQ